MATQGWFNHYDDPDDDYWEQEPVDIPARERSPGGTTTPDRLASALPDDSRQPIPRGFSEAERNGAPAPPSKSALVDVEVAADGLPSRIRLASSWKTAFRPDEYGGSIVAAYNHAMFVMISGMAKSGKITVSSPVRLRDVAPLLLRTNTYAEYQQLYSSIFSLDAQEITGPGRTGDGRPGLVVRANRSRLLSVAIAPEWARATNVEFIGQDVVDCCSRIRSARSSLLAHVRTGAGQHTVADIVRHEKFLMEREG